ncbi:MAG: glycosyl transferase family 1 [Flavobacteriales bacterium]|nr:MAG: glycosyl transferase family 1 [Flavobacteriales bacterium]
MKKVIIITYYWPPMGGGGVQRWLKTTKYLREYGWEPVIFTTENGEASVVDEGMLKQIPKGVETLRVPIWEPFALYKKLTGKKKEEKLTPGTVSEKGNSLIQNLSVWVRGNLFIPDARKFWIKPASKALNKYLKHNKVDAIVSTGPPHTTHMIALNVIKKHKIPWLADFRDPWTNIDFYHKLKLTNWADKKHKRLEQAVLDNANQVLTVSWSWAEDFHKISDRMPMVITNGYDPEDFIKVGTVTLDKKFTITHAGSLNDDRNPHALWKTLAELSKEIEGFSNDLEIKFIGQVAPIAVQELTQNGLDKNLNLIDNLPHKKVINEIIKSQVLLLPLNDTPNIDGVVPGKLYEYIGAKRPIVCIGKPDGDAAKIINETDAGKVSDFNDVETLTETIKSYYQDYKNNSLTVDSKNYERYSRKLLAGQITEELNKIIN